MGSERAPLRGLYAITPETAGTESLVARVRLAIEGGARLVQYRAKTLEPALALRQARLIAAECRASDVLFIVNDAVDLALACDADGVHLGRDDTDVAAARLRLPRGIIGVSCYAEPQRAAQAGAVGADYVAIGSMFASPTKRSAVRAPLEAIAAAKEASRLPVAAIGGIAAGNARAVVGAGADMLAVVSALFDAPDIRAAARAFSALFEPAAESRDARAQPHAL
jgi:thiamine-phosphate pyrophosphorylase